MNHCSGERVYGCEGRRSCFRAGSCAGPWCDLQLEMPRGDMLVFRDGLERGRMEWYVIVQIRLLETVENMREERLLLFSNMAIGPSQQFVCISAEHLISYSFSKVAFFLKVGMKAADFQPNNATYNELTTSHLSHCCSRN